MAGRVRDPEIDDDGVKEGWVGECGSRGAEIIGHIKLKAVDSGLHGIT